MVGREIYREGGDGEATVTEKSSSLLWTVVRIVG